MKILKLLISILFLCYSASFAQNTDAEHYLSTVRDVKQLNGNILLARDGQVITAQSYGYADFKTHVANTVDSRFNICSISKVFTSTAILQLRDAGKLSLSDDVKKYIPAFPFKGITLRNLLTHTSGLPDLELFETLVKRYPDTVISNKNIVPELVNWKKGLYFIPGEKHEYNNIGYSVLAMVIEKISGGPLSAYLSKHIFKPAGMNDTYVSEYPNNNYTNDKRCVKMHFQQHPYYDTTYVYADSASRYKYTSYNFGGTTGNGNIISTIGDLQKFDKLFFSGGLLKPATMQEAFTPLKLNNGDTWYGHMDTMDGEGKMGYGLGWNVWDQPGYGISVGHGGFMFGNATLYIHNITSKNTVIAFDNTAGSEFGRIITSCFAILYGKPPLEIRNHHSMAFAYGSTLVKQGPDAAASAFNNIKNDTAHYYLNEWEFNQLGGSLMFGSAFKGHQEMGLEVFKINTLLFPNSFNTYDSYAEGLRAAGMKKEAILMYQKSLVLNPGNEDGRRALKELLDGK